MGNNEKNEIGLAVGDQLLRRKNGRVSLVTVHRVTRTRAFCRLPGYLKAYEQPICKWGKHKYADYPASNMAGAFYEIASPEKISQDAARRVELIEKIKSYPLEKLTTQSLENILKLLS